MINSRDLEFHIDQLLCTLDDIKYSVEDVMNDLKDLKSESLPTYLGYTVHAGDTLGSILTKFNITDTETHQVRVVADNYSRLYQAYKTKNVNLNPSWKDLSNSLEPGMTLFIDQSLIL